MNKFKKNCYTIIAIAIIIIFAAFTILSEFIHIKSTYKIIVQTIYIITILFLFIMSIRKNK
mgnify:CR=1 FL=1